MSRGLVLCGSRFQCVFRHSSLCGWDQTSTYIWQNKAKTLSYFTYPHNIFPSVDVSLLPTRVETRR